MLTQRKTDAEIQSDVMHELASDALVDETDVGVTVHQSIVTLTGSVNGWGKRAAAQYAAHRVAGVLDVVNNLWVKLAGSAIHDDTDIARALRFALRWDMTVPEEQIRSTVAIGIVTLEGEVDSPSQSEDAERAVRNVTGVREVRNLIQIAPTKLIEEVKAAIEAALGRHAEREANDIDVNLRHGVLAISGRVQSWAEKQLVLGAAKGTAGVHVIEDQVAIGR
jgi:osmotically-inducible protein OsmY